MYKVAKEDNKIDCVLYVCLIDASAHFHTIKYGKMSSTLPFISNTMTFIYDAIVGHPFYFSLESPISVMSYEGWRMGRLTLKKGLNP